MEKYTIKEKSILLAAVDHYNDAGEHARNILTGEDKDEFTQKLWSIRDLRTKLLLDFAPIEIKPTDGPWARVCVLCGTEANPRVIEWAYVDGKPICELCFKKYEPEAFEKAMKLDHDYYVKEYPDQFNSDGTFKNVVTADSLPF